MVVHANFLFPLYIYPLNNAWNPLFTAATQYPDITFTAIINPSNGPDSSTITNCPNKDFIEALNSLHQFPNIHTLGYVHTANLYNCGTSGSDICPCTAPADEVKRNISMYAAWTTARCEGWSTPDPEVYVDGIFIDESPGEDNGACLDYMTDLTNHAKSTLTTKTGGSVFFNAGAATEMAYFDVADVIIILENTQAAYEAIPDIGVRNGNGKYARKSSILIYQAGNDTGLIRRDVETILSVERDGFHSMFYSDRAVDQYSNFPYAWSEIVEQVNVVAQKNKAG